MNEEALQGFLNETETYFATIDEVFGSETEATPKAYYKTPCDRGTDCSDQGRAVLALLAAVTNKLRRLNTEEADFYRKVDQGLWEAIRCLDPRRTL